MMATPAGTSPAFSPASHAYAPSPLASHSQAPTPRPNNPLPRRVAAPPSARSTVGTQAQSGVALEDPKVELARTMGLLFGVDGSEGGGEVGALEAGLEASRGAYEGAFEEGGG